MSERHKDRRRLAGRLALIVVALLSATLVIRVGIGRLLASRDPDLVLRLNSSDAAAEAARALAATVSVQPPDVKAAQLFATRSLQRDLTQDNAIAALASINDVQRRRGRARALMEAAESVSRRNLLAQLWLIEDSVQAGNVGGALHHFDVALRTHARAGDILFPVLRTAVEDDQLVAPIADLLRAGPDWRGPFLQFALSQHRPTANLAAVFARQRPLATFQGTDLTGALVAQLVDSGQFSSARLLALGKQASRSGLVQDAQFTGSGYPPFGWRLTDEPDLSARFIRVSGGRGALAINSDGGIGGVVAAQLLALAPGPYRLSIEGGSGAEGIEWAVSCQTPDGETIAKANAVSAASVNLRVAADCRAQWLTLRVSGASDSGRRAWEARPISLVRLSAPAP